MNRIRISIYTAILCLLTAWGIYFHSRQHHTQTSITNLFKISRTTEQAEFSRIEPLLLDYTVDNDIQKSINHFLQNTLAISNIHITSAQNPQEGQSGDQLFFIRDIDEQLKCVVKVFSKPFDVNGNFKRELDGFGMLSQVYGNNVHLVTTKAVGKAVIDGEPYGMVAISPARGINMQTLFINIVRLPQESSERLLALHIAQKGVEKLGTALAEFHQIHTQKEMPLDTTIFERMNHEISKIEKHLIQKNICIERSDIQHYAAYLIDQVKTIKTTRALIHGDAHLGNFVYDMDTDTVYMVDYNEIGRSVDKDGNPIGNAAMDVMNLLDIIAANKQFGLTPQEITILTEGFIKGYGTLPSKIEQDFFLLLFRIGFLSWFLKAEEEHPEQFKDSPLKKLSCYLIDEIKHSLVYFKAQEARDCCFA